MRFLAGGVLAATLLLLWPAWSSGPMWFALVYAHRWLVLEAWLGWTLAITWLLRVLSAIVLLRASGGRLAASAKS